MTKHDLLKWIESSKFQEKAELLYGPYGDGQAKRYRSLVETFSHHFPQSQDLSMFSASGRIEVSGNHTDHQLGQVIAAAIHLDTLAVVSKNQDNIIRVQAEGYSIDPVDLSDLSAQSSEYYTSMGLIRGIAYYFKERTGVIGGFDAVVTSDVFSGSGLSSSAAFEVLMAAILNTLYGDNVLNRSQLAQISQKAENVYFNKPCGLMDQMAIAQGNFCYIDFYDKDQPIVEPLASGQLLKDYTLCLVQTGGSHADLSFAYAQITNDLKDVSHAFNESVLSRVSPDEFKARLSQLKETLPTRALLRAHHYFEEIKRVQRLKKAILENNTDAFLNIIIESGQSSYMYLQNIMHPSSEQQPLALALALAEQSLRHKGAWRVHGGGFGGTILMVVPNSEVSSLKMEFETIYGSKSFIPVHLRPEGVTQVIA